MKNFYSLLIVSLLFIIVSGCLSENDLEVSAPVISSFSPTSGSVGTTVIIYGSNFSTIAANNIVKFNGTTAVVIGATTTQLTTTVPTGVTSGAISVTIDSKTATSADNFTVTTPTTLSISGFSPASGVVGTTVLISGTNFSTIASENIVKFNGTNALVSAATSTQLTVTVPAGATTGNVSVNVGLNTVISSTVYTVLSITNAVSVAFNGTTANVTNPYSANGVNVSVNNGNVIITSTVSSTEINYVISGTASEGSLKIYSDYMFNLIMNGVSITNDDGPAINIQSSKNASVSLMAGTTNTLTDGSTYSSSSEDQKGAFFSEGQLNFSGTGSLNVNGNYKHGICSDDYIYIAEGNISVLKAKSDAIHANDYFRMDSGTLTLTSSGDGIECEEGYIAINGGSLTVNSVDDGISASYEGTDSQITPYVRIIGGILNITTSGEKGNAVKSESYTLINTANTITLKVTGRASKGIKTGGDFTLTSGSVTITTTGAAFYDTADADIAAAAGINCDGNFNITQGIITISSSGSGGKGISVDGSMIVNGGTLNITTTGGIYTYNSANTSEAKAIKSDGSLTVNNGTLNISSANDGMKSETSIIINGGVVGITKSTEGMEGPIITLNNGNVSVVSSDDCLNATKGNVSAGTLFNIQNSSGTSLVTFAPVRSAYYFVFSSSGLQSGSSYKVYTGGSCSGATITNGLYSGGTYSGGTQKGSFTVSGKLTTVSL